MELTERVQSALQASVVFLDIIGYSLREVAEQFRVKKLFNSDVAYAVAPFPPGDRLMLDTGDGAALCFFGDPLHAYGCATRLRTRFAAGSARHGDQFELRIGVNHGPVRVIRDMNGQLNVIGDAINDGQRIMSFAAAGQVLVSYAFRDAICSRFTEYRGTFTYAGVRADKHGKEHRLYELNADAPNLGTTQVVQSVVNAERVRSQSGQGAPAGAASIPRSSVARSESPPAIRTQRSGWIAGVLEAVTAQLEPYLGEAARALVGQAAAQARNIDALYSTLAAQLASDADRVAFMSGKQHVVLMLAQRGRPQPPSEPLHEQVPAAADTWAASAQLLEATTARLARYVGTGAAQLVQVAAAQASSESDFFLRVAVNIRSDEGQIRFLDEVRDGPSRRV